MNTYEIHNPGRSMRVIHDASNMPVNIAPGETRNDIALADSVAERLGQLAEADQNHVELVLKPIGEQQPDLAPGKTVGVPERSIDKETELTDAAARGKPARRR